MKEKIYESERGNVHYWVSNDKTNDLPWIIFLPGLTAGHNLFDKQIEYFRSKYNCLVWDAPAHGKSRPYAMDFTLDEVAKVLHEIIQLEQIEMPIIIGQSYGAYVTQAYLSLYSEPIRGFVSIDSCPLQKKYYSKWILWWLKHTEGMYRSIPWKLLIKWSVVGLATSHYGRQNYKSDIEAYQKKYFCKLAGRGFYTVAEAIELDRPYPITCPILLLCGEKDAAGFTKNYNKQWSKGEGYELIMVPNAGHNSNTDDPDFVNRSIDTFLQKL